MYSGKALAAVVAQAEANPERFRGCDVLFWHTGGGLGLFDKAAECAPLLPQGQASRLAVQGSPSLVI